MELEKKKVQNKVGEKEKEKISIWHSLSDPSRPSERGDVQKTKVLCGKKQIPPISRQSGFPPPTANQRETKIMLSVLRKQPSTPRQTDVLSPLSSMSRRQAAICCGPCRRHYSTFFQHQCALFSGSDVCDLRLESTPKELISWR